MDTLRYYWPARQFVWRVRCGFSVAYMQNRKEAHIIMSAPLFQLFITLVPWLLLFFVVRHFHLNYGI